MNDRCEILDLPEGLRLNLLGVIVRIDRIRIVADRSGLLGGILAALTCGSPAELRALADMVEAGNGKAKAAK